MRTICLSISALLIIATLAGCSKKTRVSKDYFMVLPESFLGEPGRPNRSLYYKHEKVWEDVWLGSDRTFHDGDFVFESLVPGDGPGCDLDISPQVFVIRGKGPAAMISERILNQSITNNGILAARDILPKADGVEVIFVSKTNHTDTVAARFQVSWSQIHFWVTEAGTSTQLVMRPWGNFVMLAPTNGTTH